MNLLEKKKKLIELVSDYLKNKGNCELLSTFAWEVIDNFRSQSDNKIIPKEDFEDEFWYTIWEIQHLADEEHEKDGTLKRILLEAIEYLEGRKGLPPSYIGRRP